MSFHQKQMQDSSKFEAIYLKYYATLLVYGKTMTANEQIIEDAIQELFLVIWQKGENLVIKSSFENYLFVAFRNNLIRKIKKQGLSELNFDLPTEIDEALNFENEQQLKKWLEKLPPSQKEVIFLRYYQNKSYIEIAEILDISYQVARNFAYRGIKFLKKNMKKINSVLLIF